jgi:hypothetical protein
MRIRLEGTETEIAATLARITPVLEVQEVSRFYANRGASTLGRVYLTIVTPAASGVVRADAERTDKSPRITGRNRKEIR